MAGAAMNELTAWSYSRWRDYNKCPQLAKFKYIERLPEPPSPAMENGDAVHRMIAAYLRGDLPPNDPIPGWTYFADLFRQLRELNPLVEQQWGFDRKWGVTGWFGGDVWFRSVLDCAAIYEEDAEADVVDFKTGRPRPDETSDQAELYFLSILARYPKIRRVTVRFWYVDAGVQMPLHKREVVYRFDADMAKPLLKKWTLRAERLLTDPHYPPNPGKHCDWCYQAKSKGGKCKYG